MAINYSSILIDYYQNCTSSVTVSVGMSFMFTKCFLVLPLSLLVLYLGHQRRRQQRSFATTTHSDIITYHSAAMGLIYTLGVAIYMCGLFFGVLQVTKLGYYLWSVAFPVEISFHILTCVDRYLAIVHPVLYLGLRHSRGGWTRNISIGCIWLLCFGWIGLDNSLYLTDFPYIPYLCFLILSLVTVSFCSISVLCALIRPGPGEIGRDRARVDKKKQKAFYTITAILVVLLLCFFGYFVSFALANSHMLNSTTFLMLMFGDWCSLPSSLVLPVLFLQRSGKMLCFQQ